METTTTTTTTATETTHDHKIISSELIATELTTSATIVQQAHSSLSSAEAFNNVSTSPSCGTASTSITRPFLERIPKDLLQRTRNRDVSQKTTANETSDLLSTDVPIPEFDSLEGPSSPDSNSSTPKATSSKPLGPISPTYLAHKIQALMDSYPKEHPATPLLPTITTPPNSPLLSIVPTPTSPVSALSQNSPAAPLQGTTPTTDDELIEMLSSATIMNGSSERGKRTSVWSLLEDLRAPKGWPCMRSPTRSRKDGIVGDADTMSGNDSNLGQSVEEEDEGDAFSDESSVMMYSPLMPTKSSLVELAETEFIPMSTPACDDVPSSSSHSGVSEGRVAYVREPNPKVTPPTEKKDKQTMTDHNPDVQPVAGPSYSSPSLRVTSGYTPAVDPGSDADTPPY
ncbi:hypothetical protein L208DRAFT_192151 [Tricholoma matsutake]|nr:hypothetical protein L208DRAFT_192151 [Tricholoma matsutake 945]